MSKSKEKKERYNTLVINRVAKKYGVTTHFVRMSLRGDRHSETSEAICKDYKALVKEIHKILD